MKCDKCGEDGAKEIEGSEFDRLCRDCFTEDVRADFQQVPDARGDE